MQDITLCFRPRRARWMPDLDAIKFKGWASQTVVEFLVRRSSLTALLPEHRQELDPYAAVKLFHRLELTIHAAAQREFHVRGVVSEPIWLSAVDLKAQPLVRRRSAQ